jgi:hypothetical protein
MAGGRPDYWDYATQLELAVLARDIIGAQTALADALARPGWAARFLRVHRSHAVNPAHVQRIERLGSGEAQLTLSGGAMLRVSRGYRGVLDAFTP